ncbi:MAG TPA: helix-turn-helix transcriptional regulator [Bryobacteraceae bacterium]|nr:helix-turn-helix transcriptional regulator [Bryobacteraceae bacterium]
MAFGARLPYAVAMARAASLGSMLREWRTRRRMSQLDVASEANVSARHVSFIETGRSLPSPEMIVRLAEALDVPLQETNALLTAGGFAHKYSQHELGDEDLATISHAIQSVLTGHEPYPALAVDRYWNMQMANRAVTPLLAGVAPGLLAHPVNVLRLTLHPEGMAPRIANLAEWRNHLLSRLRQQVERTWDPVLRNLLDELVSLPAPPEGRADHSDPPRMVVPLSLRVGSGIVDLISTTMVFGTALDASLAELAIEAFYPANESSSRMLHDILGDSG